MLERVPTCIFLDAGAGPARLLRGLSGAGAAGDVTGWLKRGAGRGMLQSFGSRIGMVFPNFSHNHEKHEKNTPVRGERVEP
jgi:hypothetical protein